MPCSVRGWCPSAGPTTQLVRFPAVTALRKRWHEAVRAATGSFLPEDEVAWNSALELCVAHFERDPRGSEDQYQEPTRFVDRSGKLIKLGSCRLCHRFGRASEMIAAQSKVAQEFRIAAVLQQQSVLKVTLNDADFLQLICQECLVRVDLIKSLQRAFYFKNATFKTWTNKLPALEIVQEKETSRRVKPTIDCDLLDEDAIVGFTIDKSDPLQKQWKDIPKESPKMPTIKKKEPREPVPDFKITKCYICKIQFHDREDLLNHLKRNHVFKPRYSCSECKTVRGRTRAYFKEITAYNVHLSWHDEGERPLKCRTCLLRFVTKRGRMVHERRAHRDGKVTDQSLKSSRKKVLRSKSRRIGVVRNTKR